MAGNTLRSGALLVAFLAGAAAWTWSLTLTPRQGEAPIQAGTESVPTDTATLEAQQEKAALAALSSAATEELEAPVSERPAFVSPLEWQVLRRVASRKPEPDQELARLVNNLRFNKQLEKWQELEGTEPLRRTLAVRLLDAIPPRVENRELDTTRARELQMDLLAVLEENPEELRRRAAEEARRIGVTFEFRKAAPDS